MADSGVFRLVALMPMRHTSDRVPGKNYRLCAGRPLFHHMLDTLLSIDSIDLVVIDTDSPEIVSQSAALFPTVRCLDRPAHLLGGDVAMTEVLRHDAERCPSELYLQTHSTNPLLSANTISRAIETFEKARPTCDSLFSVTRHQTRLYRGDGTALNHDPSVLLRTQDLEPLFEENSNLYLFGRNLIGEGRRIGTAPLLFETPRLESLDIDEEADFTLAEQLLMRRAATT